MLVVSPERPHNMILETHLPFVFLKDSITSTSEDVAFFLSSQKSRSPAVRGPPPGETLLCVIVAWRCSTDRPIE